MTTDAVPAGDDPRRLLADVRGLARRVRLTQRVTWLPLLVLAVVTFGAMPFIWGSHPIESDCRVVDGGQVCKIWDPATQFYWLVAVILAYVVIAAGYVRVARARGVEARVLPYVVTGVAFTVVAFTAFATGAGTLIVPNESDLLHPSAFVQVVFRLITPIGGFGLALLVLAWLERHVALLLFALVYLAVVLVPVDFGPDGLHWPQRVADVVTLAVTGGVLLLGSAGFALAQRLRRTR